MDPGISVNPTEMTFSISRDGGAFEWAGKNLATVFCQPHRIVDPQMWRMIYDIMRFNACARRVLLDVKENNGSEMSIGEYLDLEGYSLAFRNNYLIVSHLLCLQKTELESQCSLLAYDSGYLEHTSR